MESYLQNPELKVEDEKIIKERVLEKSKKTVLEKAMKDNSNKFCEYFKYNKNKSTKFIIVEVKTESTGIGGYIKSYEDGQFVDRDFDIKDFDWDFDIVRI